MARAIIKLTGSPDYSIRSSENQDRILSWSGKSRSRGITLIELMIAVGIVAVVLGVLGFLSLGTWRTFLISSTYMDAEGMARLAMDWMVRDIRGASQIYTSVDIGGQSYDSGYNELVLGSGSDYIVYYLTSVSGLNQLNRIVDKGGDGSADVTKLIASDISSLNFEDGVSGGSPTPTTTLVDLSLTVSPTRFGEARDKTLTSAVRLRNR